MYWYRVGLTGGVDGRRRTKVRAQTLRLMAEECRAIAEGFSTKEARAQMHRIADSSEMLARTAEEEMNTFETWRPSSRRFGLFHVIPFEKFPDGADLDRKVDVLWARRRLQA